MAYADPQTLTISGTSTTFVRINGSGTDGLFRDGAGSRDFIVKQSSSKTRQRREARITVFKDYANPVTGLTTNVSASIGIFIDEPKAGFSDAELISYKSAIVAWATDANVTKLLTGEN